MNGEWDSCLSREYDFMCGGKLSGGDVKAVQIKRGWIRVFCSKVLEPDSVMDVSKHVKLQIASTGLPDCNYLISVLLPMSRYPVDRSSCN